MKFFIFSVAAFVVVTLASFFVPPYRVYGSTAVLGQSETREYKTVPVLSLTSSYPTFSAASVYALDIDSGVSLYQKNSDTKVLPASTTKIITAMVAFDYYPLNQVVTVSIPEVDGQKMGLQNGEKITVENLLYGLLLFSANDAAEQLTSSYPGGKDAFISKMNEKAEEFGMTNSHFQNPQGYEDPSHVSTSYDMAKAAVKALNNKTFSKIVSTKEYTAESVDGIFVHKMTNLNELLGSVDGVLGVKTGWTESAKENLVTYIVRNGHKVVIAILGSDDRFGETRKMIDWIFESYVWRSVPGSYEGNYSSYSSLSLAK